MQHQQNHRAAAQLQSWGPPRCRRLDPCAHLISIDRHEFSSYCNRRGTELLDVGAIDTCGGRGPCVTSRRCLCYSPRVYGPQCQFTFTLTQSLTPTRTERTSSRTATRTLSVVPHGDSNQQHEDGAKKLPCEEGYCPATATSEDKLLVPILAPSVVVVVIMLLLALLVVRRRRRRWADADAVAAARSVEAGETQHDSDGIELTSDVTQHV